jgi:hypothetical protein
LLELTSIINRIAIDVYPRSARVVTSMNIVRAERVVMLRTASLPLGNQNRNFTLLIRRFLPPIFFTKRKRKFLFCSFFLNGSTG